MPATLLVLAGSVASSALAGTFPAVIDAGALDGLNGIMILGEEPFDNAGVAVSGAHDVNCDGIDDVFIGANSHGLDAGLLRGGAYVIFGVCPPAPSPCLGDVNNGGSTDVFEFADLASNFGDGPGATRDEAT